MNSYFEKADIIISHGGTGTVLELLSSGKKFIVVANTSLADNHQVEFLNSLSSLYPLKWMDDVVNLKRIITSPIPHIELGVGRGELGENLKKYIS